MKWTYDKPGEWAVMYVCVRDIDFPSSYVLIVDLFRQCVLFLVFRFLTRKQYHKLAADIYVIL